MKLIKKTMIFLSLFVGFSFTSHAQTYGYYGGFNPYPLAYYGAYGPSIWSQMSKTDKAYVAVNTFFNTVDYAVGTYQRHQAFEQQLMQRNQQIEDYKSMQNYYYQGIPPFSPYTPDGKPRNPKITWDDVEKIK